MRKTDWHFENDSEQSKKGGAAQPDIIQAVMFWQGPASFGTDFAERITNGQAEPENEKHPVHGDRRKKEIKATALKGRK
jgi:hypothetical protein